MSHREDLAGLIEYDRWANQRWAGPAEQLGRQDILLHVLQAQIIWLSRLEGTVPWTATWESFSMELDRSLRSWQRFLFDADLSHVVSYETSAGVPYENTVVEIARQVLNHGTYHRGHLRGLAEAASIEFPETDYILFCRSR